MTTIPDVGLEAISDILIGQGGQIDALAVGTGTNETASATALGNEVFRADIASPKVSFQETGPTGEVDLSIEVTGGNDVPDGTVVTETAALIDGSGGGGTLLLIDQIPGVEVESGDIQRFVIPFAPVRGAA
jgi:hypothetical protein